MEGLIDYSRQAEFDTKLTLKPSNGTTHVIVGCGGVGFWLGVILAMQGHKDFILLDGQKLETSNLNRVPAPATWVGVNKAVALRKIIRCLRPVTRVLVSASHIQLDNMEFLEQLLGKFGVVPGGGNAIVWDCTDNAVIQNAINVFCGRHKDEIVYRKIGYEGFEIGTYTEYAVWIPDGYETGYRTSNACAATSAMAAVVGFMAEGLEMMGDVKINVEEMIKGNLEEVPVE